MLNQAIREIYSKSTEYGTKVFKKEEYQKVILRLAIIKKLKMKYYNYTLFNANRDDPQ